MKTPTMKHKYGVYNNSSKGEGHPMLFGFKEAEMFEPFPDGGGYPKRFLKRAFEIMGISDPEEVLHVCSGSMRSGICVDIRITQCPTVVADGLNLPFKDESFNFIMIDPPYTPEYAANLYGTQYPKPGKLLKEAARVLRPGGKVGLLHFMVPMNRYPLKIITIIGITCGLGQQIRAFTILQKLVDAHFRYGK